MDAPFVDLSCWCKICVFKNTTRIGEKCKIQQSF